MMSSSLFFFYFFMFSKLNQIKSKVIRRLLSVLDMSFQGFAIWHPDWKESGKKPKWHQIIAKASNHCGNMRCIIKIIIISPKGPKNSATTILNCIFFSQSFTLAYSNSMIHGSRLLAFVHIYIIYMFVYGISISIGSSSKTAAHLFYLTISQIPHLGWRGFLTQPPPHQAHTYKQSILCVFLL